MADPLSVAGLAAGLVSLGLQTCGGITKYIDALDCREQDIASIKQHNNSLRNTIQVVETSLTQLHGDHPGPTAAVRSCLDSCRNELRALDDLVAQLAAGFGQSTAGRRNKVKSQGKKLLYPFSRPKLEQLETRLRNANVTLQPALQALGISVSQSGTERLASLVSTSLLIVQTEVSAVNAPLRDMHDSLSGMDTRLENLESLVAAATKLLAHRPVVDGKPQEARRSLLHPPKSLFLHTISQVTGEVAVRRLLGKPAMLREICDVAGNRPRSLPTSAGVPPTSRDATQTNQTISAYLEANTACVCRTRQSSWRKNVVWGSLALLSETTTEQHGPACPAGLIRGADQSRKVSLRYTGLQSLLKSAVQISFAMRFGAGGWSLSPNFTYHPTVARSAPAFRIMEIISDATRIAGQCTTGLLWWEKLMGLALTKMLALFRTGKASPLAVDYKNKSLLHHLTQVISFYGIGLRPYQGTDILMPLGPLLDVYKFLVKCKVPAYDYDIHGHTPFSQMTRYGYNPSSLRAASDIILHSNGDLDLAVISSAVRPLFVDMRTNTVSRNMVTEALNFLSASPIIAKAYGCGPLSLAILANDHVRVGYLVEHYPATLTERNLFGQSPLHLAVDKPTCLRLITRAADDRLLNEPDNSGTSPFEAALLFSGFRCREGRGRRRCCRCQCAECLVILLKADCALPSLKYGWSYRELIVSSSQRCRLRYIRAIKDRRDRLQRLALDSLSAAEAEELGLWNEKVLDYHAPRVAQLLQQRGVCIPGPLSLTRFPPRQGSLSPSVYEALMDPADAELFFRLGFRDTGSWLKDPSTILQLPGDYLEWLHNHGFDALFRPLWTSDDSTRHGLFTAHATFFAIAQQLTRLHREGGKARSEHGGMSSEWIQSLHVALLRPGLADSCRCKCSAEGCTPLTHYLKGTMWPFGDVWGPHFIVELEVAARDLGRFLDLFGAHLDLRHHMASVRFLTFMALEIKHTCCLLPEFSEYWRPGEEDVEEIQEEYAYQLALLEELLDEFESDVVGILQNDDGGCAALKDFWKRTWFNRVCEVRARLEGDALSDDERRRAEEIGVVWDQPVRPSPEVAGNGNPYHVRTQDHWLYELDQIEVEV